MSRNYKFHNPERIYFVCFALGGNAIIQNRIKDIFEFTGY